MLHDPLTNVPSSLSVLQDTTVSFPIVWLALLSIRSLYFIIYLFYAIRWFSCASSARLRLHVWCLWTPRVVTQTHLFADGEGSHLLLCLCAATHGGSEQRQAVLSQTAPPRRRRPIRQGTHDTTNHTANDTTRHTPLLKLFWWLLLLRLTIDRSSSSSPLSFISRRSEG